MKKKNNKAYEVQPEVVVKDANHETVARIHPVEQRYKTVPVDLETYNGIMQLCAMRGFGQRGQGALVRILVKSELAKVPKDT